MGNMKDIAGMRFGKWTVIQLAGKNKYGAYMWTCRCDCGVVRDVQGSTLRRGNSTSCGCDRSCHNPGNRIHGGKKERLYGVWHGMRDRCENPHGKYYQRYGARGITVCSEWNDYSIFRDWALQNGYDPSLQKYECTLDRIDNNLGYYPENCRWTNQREQSNNRASNHLLTYNGETHTISEWSHITGLNKHTIRQRVGRLGWEVGRALTEPPHHK